MERYWTQLVCALDATRLRQCSAPSWLTAGYAYTSAIASTAPRVTEQQGRSASVGFYSARFGGLYNENRYAFRRGRDGRKSYLQLAGRRSTTGSTLRGTSWP